MIYISTASGGGSGDEGDAEREKEKDAEDDEVEESPAVAAGKAASLAAAQAAAQAQVSGNCIFLENIEFYSLFFRNCYTFTIGVKLLHVHKKSVDYLNLFFVV